ncbi:MAG: protein kinase [Holophagaceae bacterium]
MPLSPGSLVGPYEILGPLATGGMSEVYRGRDPKLGRMVAIKVLPALFSKDPAWLRRFETEARAASALNHPNILVVHDLGLTHEIPYLVTELLEGETLRERLARGPLPLRDALDVAGQVTEALEAAHGAGILHRDVKPENVFLTRDGRAKLLDFGLAKAIPVPAVPQGAEPRPAGALAARAQPTAAGSVFGTIGYMSPEQARGEPLDGRSDLFALGIVLWELLTGRNPFQREDFIGTLQAILKEDPPHAELPPDVPPGLARLLDGALAKDRAQRLHCAHDVAFALESLRDEAGRGGRGRPEARSRPGTRLPGIGLGLLAGAALLAAGVLAWRRGWPPFEPAPAPSYTRVNLRPGTLHAARFTPDGQEILLAGQWGQEAFGLSVYRPDKREEQDLPFAGTNLLAVAPDGEMLLAQAPSGSYFTFLGTLASAGSRKVAPKPLMGQVAYADRSAKGDLAVVTGTWGNTHVECPPGHPIPLEGTAWCSWPRFSPDGRTLAFLAHPNASSVAGSLAVYDLASGRVEMLPGRYSSLQGLAWRGEELWYTAAERGPVQALRARRPGGPERLVLRLPGDFALHDVRSDGTALLALQQDEDQTYFLEEGRPLRDLSWGLGIPWELSDDGETYVFQEYSNMDGLVSDGYAGRTAGGPPVLLSRASSPPGLSPDGSMAAVLIAEPSLHVQLIPLGTGAPRALPPGSCTTHPGLAPLLSRDGRQVFWVAAEKGKGYRYLVQDLAGGPPRTLTEEGVGYGRLSPDGRSLLTADGRIWDTRAPGAAPRVAKGTGPGTDWRVARWSEDSRRLVTWRAEPGVLSLALLDPDTGVRTPFRAVNHPRITRNANAVRVSADGRRVLWRQAGWNSTLLLVSGLN